MKGQTDTKYVDRIKIYIKSKVIVLQLYSIFNGLVVPKLKNPSQDPHDILDIIYFKDEEGKYPYIRYMAEFLKNNQQSTRVNINKLMVKLFPQNLGLDIKSSSTDMIENKIQSYISNLDTGIKRLKPLLDELENFERSKRKQTNKSIQYDPRFQACKA